MKERIIVVPNTNKLLLSLAYHNKASFNTRVFTPVELAREALLRSGKVCNKTFVSRQEELSYYKEIIESVSYFKTSKLADIKSVNQTINTMRELITSDEDKTLKDKLAKGDFKEKNDALYEIYSKYINKLTSEDKIDTIGLIRYAIENSEKINDEFITLEEYKLQPLAIQLVNVVSNNKEMSIFDLFEIDKKEININGYKNCYGTSNEVETILNDIFTNKKADECVVACADYSNYAQTLYDIASKYNITLTFGEGISLINSYPGKLLQQYYSWSVVGNFGWEPFNKLIYSPYFNFDLLDSLVITDNEEEFKRPKFYERLSRLRLTNDLIINKKRLADFKAAIARGDINDNYKLEKYVVGFELIANELALPIEEFIGKYFVARNTDEFVIKLDNCAKDALINELKTIKNIGLEITNDVIEALLRKPVYRQGNLPGHIHITTIDGALSSLRKNLYICGLSSTSYPGSPKENPLLLDSDLKAFDNVTLTSEGKVKEKRNSLFNLITLASSLDNEINLSYPGLNVSELKNNNASSLLFEIYKTQHQDKGLDDFKKQLVNVGYFETNLSRTKQIGEAYVNAKQIVYKALDTNNQENTSLDIGRYSPSALNTFFNCKKQFFYQNLLKLSVPDDYDPYEVIPANEQGTLAHALMEYLGTHPMDENSFTSLAGQVFDEYTKITVPLINEKINDVKEQFVQMLDFGWRMDQEEPGELLMAEEDKDAIHSETGIKIHGFPDRVQRNTKDGKVVIIDFKTERDKYAHKQDDIDTCLQVAIYAYIVESKLNIKVDRCEYRMLRFEDGIVTCEYNQEIKQALTDKLKEFKKSLESGDYSIEPFDKETEKNKCKYCRFGAICGKVVTDAE